MTFLTVRGVSKAYGATRALDDVDFDVHAGAVNVLIGENGAGKSTLMRIIAGVEQPDRGVIAIDGAAVRFASIGDAARQGVAIVFQELNLCSNLTVVENLFLGRERVRGIAIDRAAERQAARVLLDRLGAQDIDVDAPVGTLRIGQQQIVEIARALGENVRVLILDEPTSALGPAEVATLFGVIDDLRRSGVAIVYISHRLNELMRIGDQVTVLRDGRRVAHAPIAGVTTDWIVGHMLGGAAARTARDGSHVAGPAVLEATGLSSLPGDTGAPLFGIDVMLRAGEVTAFYGLLGAGRTELFEILCGARAGSGTVRLNGTDISALDLASRVERRLVLAPEDRQAMGLFPNLTVGGNLGLGMLDRLTRHGIPSVRAETAAVGDMLRRLRIKAPSGATPIDALSGGNQQKVVLGRCLMPGPAAILLDEPSRGVDVGARGDLFETIRGLGRDGLAVAFATSDLAEALDIADRIVVIAGGRITLDVPAAQADEPMLVAAANAGTPVQVAA